MIANMIGPSEDLAGFVSELEGFECLWIFDKEGE
jgi:hypothetical protein